MRDLMGTNLQDLYTFQNGSKIRNWINEQSQEDLDRLGLGLTTTKTAATQTPQNSTSSGSSGTESTQAPLNPTGSGSSGTESTQAPLNPTSSGSSGTASGTQGRHPHFLLTFMTSFFYIRHIIYRA